MSDIFDHYSEAMEDALDGRTADEGPGAYTWQRSYRKVCYRCGAEHLGWKAVDGKWRLVDTGDNVHICRQN